MRPVLFFRLSFFLMTEGNSCRTRRLLRSLKRMHHRSSFCIQQLHEGAQVPSSRVCTCSEDRLPGELPTFQFVGLDLMLMKTGESRRQGKEVDKKCIITECRHESVRSSHSPLQVLWCTVLDGPTNRSCPWESHKGLIIRSSYTGRMLFRCEGQMAHPFHDSPGTSRQRLILWPCERLSVHPLVFLTFEWCRWEDSMVRNASQS